MTWPDVTNGLFESFGSVFILLHCLTAWRDKQVKGVNLWAVVFFTAWGGWNLYYYPHLGQWISFAGGIGIVVTNSLWIGLLIFYGRKET